MLNLIVSSKYFYIFLHVVDDGILDDIEFINEKNNIENNIKTYAKNEKIIKPKKRIK